MTRYHALPLTRRATARWRSRRSKRSAPRSICAKGSGPRSSVGLVGPGAARATASIGGCGAARWLAVDEPMFAEARYATDAAAAEALARAAGATLVVAPGTSRWLRVLPGVAHRLGGRADTHLTGLEVTDGTVAATRWYYRQRIEAVQARTERPWVLAGRSRLPRAVEGRSGGGDGRDDRGRVAGRSRAHPRDRRRGADGRRARPSARMRTLLFVAGAGWTKKQADGQTHGAEAETLILGFLARAKASLGSSKSLVDLGGRGAGRAPLPDAPEPGRTDRLHAAAPEGALDLLPRRGTARRRLALHHRAPRDQPRSRTAAGRAARPTCSMSPTRFR